MFLIYSYFLRFSASLFLQILYYGSYSGPQFFYKQLQLLRVEAPKWPKVKQLLSTVKAQIVPRLKQLKLRHASQQSTFLELLNTKQIDRTQTHVKTKTKNI